MDIFNIILSAVSSGLDGLYNSIDIYTETVPNELPERCFIIEFAGDTTVTRAPGGVSQISGKIDIAYFPAQMQDDLEANKDMYAKLAEISLQLKYVSFEGTTIRLKSHKGRIVDNVLHDICDYSTHIYTIENGATIDKVTAQKEDLK